MSIGDYNCQFRLDNQDKYEVVIKNSGKGCSINLKKLSGGGTQLGELRSKLVRQIIEEGSFSKDSITKSLSQIGAKDITTTFTPEMPNPIAKAPPLTRQLSGTQPEKPVMSQEDVVKTMAEKKKNILKDLPQIYSEMIKDLTLNLGKLEPNDQSTAIRHFETAKQTIEGLAILAAFKNEIKASNDNDLPSLIRSLTGIVIHKDLQLAQPDSFLRALLAVIHSLESAYQAAQTPAEKIRLFKKALSWAGCLEGRFSQIIDYGAFRNSFLNKVQYEIEDFNEKRNKKGYMVAIDDFILHLREVDFFKRNGITEYEFRLKDELKNISLLHTKPGQVPLADINERIIDEIAFYKTKGKGLEVFKEYVLESAELTKKERSDIDNIIKKFFETYPVHLKAI